jgi:hypothetical protein
VPVTANRFCAPGFTGERARISVHGPSAESAASSDTKAGALPRKWLVSTSTPWITPGQPELDHAPVVAGHPLAAALPAVHPLAALGVLVLDEHAPPRLEQVFLLGEKVVAGRQRPPADALGGQINQPRKRQPLIGRWCRHKLFSSQQGFARRTGFDRAPLRHQCPAKIRSFHRAVKHASVVGRNLVAVVGGFGLHHEGHVRLPHHEVGVVARTPARPCDRPDRPAGPAARTATGPGYGTRAARRGWPSTPRAGSTAARRCRPRPGRNRPPPDRFMAGGQGE